MPFVASGAPEPLAIHGPFAALTIDAERRRVFAAGARRIVVLDADTGKVLATIRIGGTSSIAIEPLGGHLFAGTRDGRISEIDPDRGTVVRSLDAGGAVDLLYYDSKVGRLYADGAGRAWLATFDARTFTAGASVALPGRVPASLAPDPVTGELYVAFADRPEIAILDPVRGTVRAAFPTPGVPGNPIVRFDEGFGQIVVAGSNGVLDVYDRAGTRLGRIAVPAGVAACDLDSGDHVLACTGPTGVTFVQLQRDAAPSTLGFAARPDAGPAALDTRTHDALVVRSGADGSGAALERFSAAAPAPSPAPSPR